MLAVSAYRSGDAAGVRAAIAALRGPDAGEVEHLLAQDWEARLAFHATGHL
jgi:hypothetical protein